MTEQLDDEWIAARSQGLDPRIMHALGVINLLWNTCEHGLWVLFCSTTTMNGQVALILLHDLGDVQISDRIRDLLPLSIHNDLEKEAIDHALKLYDVNRLNRNQLTHFSPAFGPDGLELYRKKGPELMKEMFPSDLQTVRRIADEIMQLGKHLSAIGNYFLAKNRGDTQRSLPEKPPLPERLWTPRPPDQPKPPRPPRSSQV